MTGGDLYSAVLAIGLSLLPIAAQHDTSVKGLVAAASGYLSGYQKQLSFLLADEQITQRVFDEQGREIRQRTMRGEFFVTYATGNWTSVHDVAEVDGQAVIGRSDLRQLLQREPLPALGRRLIERNAAFNIGSITRNFNEPTLALLILDPIRRSQFTFDRTRVERDGGAEVATLRFKEKGRPTLVRGMDGRDVSSTGDLTIEAGTGRIRETFMQFTHGPVVARLITTYARDSKLDVWVPVTFEERYERGSGPRPHEVIVCETTYSNYRRFEVDIRIR